MKIQKFEAFKPSDIKSDDVYLKNFIDGEKPETTVPLLKNLGLNNEQNSKLEDIKESIKKISWKDLKVKKTGSSFANFTVYFELPESITSELKSIDSTFYKENVASKRLQMEIEASNYNRTHIEPIPVFMRGLGLGYKMYKAVIKRLGYLTTFDDASSTAKKLWSNLVQDPDFYALITDKGALLIDKKFNKLQSEEIILGYIRDFYGINISGRIDRDIRNKFHSEDSSIKVDPEMKKAFINLKLNRLDVDVFRRYNRILDSED